MSKLQNPNPVCIQFLLRKPESGSGRTPPESGQNNPKSSPCTPLLCRNSQQIWTLDWIRTTANLV